uniref:Essential meiotic structure-specific endonuclease 1 n=1 Tax=Cyprinodon variegatus TaxID=28743 RepID=A0A3Q2E6L5_CYPVA
FEGSSGSDEELPVFDFLQPRPNTDVGNSGSVDVMMISSDSEDELPYVPLAQRLKLRQDRAVLTERNAPNEAGSESERLLSLHQERRTTPTKVDNPPLRAFSTSESGDPSPTRTKAPKRTAEEIQASREEALKRRQARERQQQEQERQRAERKALAEAAKALRPEECIKHMVVAVDPALLQLEGGGTLLAAVQALGCSCSIEKQELPRSVTWARRAPTTQVVKKKQQKNSNALNRHGRSDCSPTLTSWVQGQQRRHPAKTLSLAVIDLENYFRFLLNQIQIPFIHLSSVAMVHLQLHTGVSVHFLSTWKEFSDHITMTTKAVAEAPFKREREQTGFSFYLESEWAGGQRVDRAGKGLLQVWKRQIQQFNRVSPDVAAAILAAYPSPQLLRKAYSQCKTENQKLALLADLLIRRGEGITSTTRRVGPELSKRLYLLMNSCDPEQILDAAV